ncbi:hypothetical protein CKM354_001291800 [Cercospora kikuchii]|uniref:Aminoglycoside phosphotransferase domain-containing protein n=1 Tax=Cercospora kikuchii TaxID=84275 RepID=A0A9P3L1G3_9PEZI|nr:uncharacterized protein CKM354_001291800 [Cercospora kikuchii]GIZ49901.1 hypothetical protein CKM354_001291800 [Cercospora kikuchii]
MSTLGSGGWFDAGPYPEGHIQHIRVKDFVETINWNGLRDSVTAIRAAPCQLSERYSRGHFNVVRKIEFADGVQWIARLRLPDSEETGRPELLGAQKTMEVEIATMEYLRKHTIIPVPEVFAYDLDANNEIGAPYMILSYIHGTSAEELADAKSYDLHSNTDFWKQMAAIQMELASCTFDQIGSIYKIDGHFSIGPEVVSGQGPWDTADAFWHDLTKHYQDIAHQYCDENIKDSPSFELPKKFTDLIKSYGKPDHRRFHLVNRDFGIHNVLVNDDFEIVGVIDFDGVIAAPIEMVAQFPCVSGIDRPMPFYEEIEKREPAIQRIKRERPRLDRYVGYLREAAQASRTKEDLEAIVDWMTKDGASVVGGLQSYHQHQLFVNEAWWKAYEKLAEKQQTKVEGQEKQ